MAIQVARTLGVEVTKKALRELGRPPSNAT